MTMAPGWYSDPFSNAYLRWWDGARWTASTTVAGATPPPLPAPENPYATPAASAGPAAPPTPASLPPPAAPGPYTPQQPWGSYAGPSAWQPQVATFPLAGYGARVAARLIDWLILSVVLIPIGLALLWTPFKDFLDSFPPGSRPPSQQAIQDFTRQIFGRVVLVSALSFVVQFAYEVPQLVAYGCTPGKRLMGLRIRPLAEDRLPTWREASIRWAVAAVGGLLGGGLFTLLDNLFPLWDKPWRQTLHDKAAKTVVVPR
jgi:uncharacterized RDD family membrane protein YckC